MLEAPDPGAAAPAVKAHWPDNWRELAAGGNDGVSKLIGRFTDPAKIAAALFNARQELSTRPKSLAADATPEQITAWRLENGVPEKPEGYLEKLPEGLIIGEADKPLVGKFAEKMHAANESPATVHRALQAYYEIQETQAAALEEANETARSEGTEALMAEWGPEFKSNRNAIQGLMGMIPEDARNSLMQARDANGVLLFNQAPVMRAFAQLARELNPAAAVVPNHGGDPGKSIADEKKAIEADMRSPKADELYWKDEAKQKRYRELVDAESRMKQRAA